MTTIIVDNKRNKDALHVYSRTLVGIASARAPTSPRDWYSLWIEKVEPLAEQHSEQHTALREADRKGGLRKHGVP